MAKSKPFRRPIGLGQQQVQELAASWAREMFAPLPGAHPARDGWSARNTQAVVVLTDDRDDASGPRARKRCLARHTAARGLIAEALRFVEAGDLQSARSVVQSARERDLPPAHWCETVEELSVVLADCLEHGEQCYESGPVEGPAGRVVQMVVWYDPSHPVGS